MKAILSNLKLIGLIFFAAISIHVKAINNQNNTEALCDYSFNVGNFHEICILNNVNIVYTHSIDSIGHVKYTSTPEFDNAFIFTNNKGSLKIEVLTEDIGKPNLPTLYVSSRKLDKIDNYSDFNIRVESNIKADTFKATLIGNGSIVVNDLDATNVAAKITAGMGTIIISGKCTNADYKLTGTGTIQANMLKATNVNCRIFGGGSISTFPLRTLNVKGIGTTKIHYRGNPIIKHRGGGKLIPEI